MIFTSHTSLWSHRLARYGLALVIVLAAVLVRMALVPVMGLNVPYVTIYPAIMIVAVMLGAGPGVFATLAGILLAERHLMQLGMAIEWNLSLAIRAAIVLGASLYLGRVGRTLRAARAKAEAEAASVRTTEEALRRQVGLIDAARTELDRSREDLNRAQAVAHTGSWRLDVHRNELLWSEENWRIFGVPWGTPLTYETFLNAVHPDDRAEVHDAWSAALRGEPYDIEHRIVVDNTIKWVRERAELEFDAQGKLLGGFGTTQDITERKHAEEAILRAKEEWERTFDTVPDLITVLDRDHGILRVNKAMANRLGLTPAQCVGRKCFHCVHGAPDAPASCPHALTLADGGEHTAEVHEDHLGGDFLITTTPLMDAQGQMMGSVHVARDITERNRVEQAVRESEQRYRSLFSTMSEGFALHEIICDSDGRPCDYRFLDINPAFEKLTGLKRDDLIGRTVLEVMPETEPVWIERYGRVALTGKPDHFEHVSASLGRFYEVNVYRTAPGRFAVIFDDVSDLKAMQQREKEDAIRMAWGQSAIDTINAMLDGVVLLELDGTVISINPAVARMTGLDGGAVVGRNIGDLLPQFMAQDDLRKAQRGLAVLRRGGVPELLPPLFLMRPDGKVLHVLPSLSLMDAPEGGRRLAVLTLKDVTELHESAQRLEQSERNYRELVENANSIILRITPDHTITFFNEFAQRFFGYAAEEVLGRNVIGTIAPEVDSEGRDLRAMARDVTASPELHATNENENMGKDGRRMWVHWSNRAIRDDQGNVVEVLCVGTDITHRREMEAEARRYQQRLRELTERLAAAEEEDRWRISRYIHDTIIQNLSLSSIRLGSMAQPLTDARLTDEAQALRQIRKLLEDAIDECRMVMSDLTPALLYELGLIPALHDLAHRLEAKYGARMAIEDDGRERPMSHPLRGLLFESVRELVMNALKHAGPCDIRVTVGSRDDEWVIRVEDRGKGFDTGKANTPPGHQGGFGLFSIRQRLRGLDGRLELDSTPGQGTTATLCVPLEKSGRES